MSNVTLLSGISGLSFDSHILSPFFFSFVYLISSCSFCFVIFLLTVHSPALFFFSFFFFPPENSPTFFIQRQAFLCVALVEDESWKVVCAACCHVALVFAISHLCKTGFCPFFCDFFVCMCVVFLCCCCCYCCFFHQTEWSTLPTCMYVFFHILRMD